MHSTGMRGSGGRSRTDKRRVEAQVCELELQLLEPRVRRDPVTVDRLLHPDFVEFGSSGRVWDKPAVIAALTDNPGSAPAVSDLRAERLDADVVLVTYRAHHQGAAASLRASVWVRCAQGWRVRFHQGTVRPNDGEMP